MSAPAPAPAPAGSPAPAGFPVRFYPSEPSGLFLFRVVDAATGAPIGGWTTEARAVIQSYDRHHLGDPNRLERRLWVRSHVSSFAAWNAAPASAHEVRS